MNDVLTRRRCQTRVDALELPAPFTLDACCRALGERRGRPIVLRPEAMTQGGMFGIWMATAQADVVFYERDTSPLHQQHIICHELGHMIQRADSPRAAGSDLTLGHGDYGDREEYEAELFATLLTRRITRAAVGRQAGSPADEVVARIRCSLERVAW